MELKDWLSIMIPASVTIIGLIINYIATRNSIKNEIEKQQGSIKLEKLLQCLEDYQDTYRAIMNSTKLNEEEKDKEIEQQVLALQKIMDYTYLYGSEDTCKVAAAWQHYTYVESQNDEQKIAPICYANLLIAQICLDVTGECNKPSYYYTIKLKDYQEKQEEIRSIHNSIVNKIGLHNKQKLFL